VEPPRAEPPRPEPLAGTDDVVVRVDITVPEAILGGRVSVPTPTGPVRVSVPPCTSSGTRLRLRGKGPLRADGTQADLYAELRIVVPRELDEESRRLIERFAELNPTEG
jgi:DnaJ-class molecular chaperone